ncbi:MAG: hypothetical protein ACJ762_13270, partial [Solirubrobacteraceae bacterium]
MPDRTDMDVQLFEAAPTGGRSVLLRLAGQGAPDRLSTTLIVQGAGRAEQLRALPASEVVDGGAWRAAFAIERDLLESATRFTLVAGAGRPLTLDPPVRRRAATTPVPDPERARLESLLAAERTARTAAEERLQAERARTETALREAREAASRLAEAEREQAEAADRAERDAAARTAAEERLRAAEAARTEVESAALSQAAEAADARERAATDVARAREAAA